MSTFTDDTRGGKPMATGRRQSTVMSLLVAAALVAMLVLPSIGTAGFVSPAVVIGADTYESDDTSATAKVVPETSWHTFHDDGDEDWVKVTVTATDTPIIAEVTIVDGKSGADTQVNVYEADGTTQVFHNDDHDSDGFYFETYSSAAYYVAPKPGTYFVKAYQNGDDVRCEYRLMVRTGVGLRVAAGPTRYETAAQLNWFIASDAHLYGEEADWQYLVVASGTSFADALVAGAFASMVTEDDENCGVLLTDPNTLTPTTEAEITATSDRSWYDDESDPPDTKVYIMGGPGAVSQSVMDAIAALPYVDYVERLWGPTRYDTAVAAMRELDDEFSVDDDAYIVSGTSWPDSLVGGAVAAADTDMFLLTPPGGLPTSVIDFLDYMSLDDVVVVGGTAAVSDTVVNQLNTIAGGDIDRLSGDTRYSTARAVWEWWKPSTDSMVLVSGESWPDGVCSAPLAAYWMDDAPVLLTPRDSLAWDVKKWMDDNGPFSKPSYLIGGSGAVSDAVYNEWADYY